MIRFFHRILFAALTLILLAPAAIQAQQQEPDSSQGQRRARAAGMIQRQREHMAMLAQKLNLTDAQKEQFQQIGRDMRKQGMAIRQDSSLSDAQKREKMLALRKQSHQQMFAVLTPEQKEQLKQMREQHKKEPEKKSPGDQASGKKPGSAADDDDPFAGMTSDDDDGPENGSGF
jgi:Spy/CpxP family protein refolding chaperone